MVLCAKGLLGTPPCIARGVIALWSALCLFQWILYRTFSSEREYPLLRGGKLNSKALKRKNLLIIWHLIEIRRGVRLKHLQP